MQRQIGGHWVKGDEIFFFLHLSNKERMKNMILKIADFI